MAESNEFYQDEDNDHLDPNIRAELRKSKERAREAEAAKAEAELLKRELAFTKAGIPDDKFGALFRKAYDGEADAEAVRKAAEEYGIFEPAEQGNDQVADELERQRTIAGATGTNTSGPTSQQDFLAGIQGASSVDEVMEVVRSLGAESGVFAPGTR
jgi:hypothetical protein